MGLACGLWPLLRLRARELTDAVRAADSRTASGGSRQFGNGLVVAEIALAFALLVGAGLLMKNLVLLLHRDAGIRTDRIVAFDLSPAGPHYDSPEQLRVLYHELYARLSHAGGVQQAGFVSHLPMYRFGWNGEFSIEGGNPWGPNDAPLVEYRWYYGDYLPTLGIPLVRGRLLDSRDGDGTRTVLINQAMADKFWPGRDPIGKRFGQSSDTSQWYEVVGVVGNVRSFGLTRRTPYEFYRTIDQNVFAGMTGVIRTSAADPASIVPTVRSIVASIDPSLPVAAVQTMDDVVADSVGQPRLLSALTTLFGGLAGLLAMLGIYGVMGYNVRRQRREFGIRLALGADPGRLRTLVVGRGLLLSGIGVAIGAFGAWALTGVLSSMLNDVRPTDPSIFAGMAALVIVVTAAATWPPARQAARVDPTMILRDL